MCLPCLLSWRAHITQVERNREGSRPKELFDDLIEDMEGEYEKAKVRAAVALAPAAPWRTVHVTLGGLEHMPGGGTLKC